MAIQHVHTDTSADIASATSTVTITLPTGSVSTDVVVAVFGTDNGVGVSPTVTAPSGWTAINTGFTVSGSAGRASLFAFWALGNVSNLGFTNSNSGATFQQGWTCSAFSGCNLTTPIDATGTTNSSTGSASLTTNAVTIVTVNAWHCIALCDWLGGQMTATSFTLKENGNPPTNASAALLYNTTPKSIGSTGTVAVSDSASATGQIINGMPFALRPAVTATFLAPPAYMVPQAVAHAANW